MTSFFHRLNDDFAVADNLNMQNMKEWIWYKKITSLDDVYCVHIAEGGCKLEINEHEIVLEKYSFLVLFPGCFVRSLACTDDLKYFCFVVKENTTARFFSYFSLNLAASEKISKYYLTSCDAEHHRTQYDTYCLLKKNLMTGSVFDFTVSVRMVEIMLIKDLELYVKEKPEALNKPTKKELVFYEFQKLVKEHCLTERSLSFYAKELDLTPKYLSAVIKEVSGKQFTYWIDEPILIESERLLYYTDMSVREVGEKLGFSNQSKFGRFFKNATGVSPSFFRVVNEKKK